MVLLDTNHCSRIIQGHPAILTRLGTLQDQIVSTCVIVRGELIYMAENSQQRVDNLKLVHAFLSEIMTYPIDEEAADQYGRLKAAIVSHYGPKERARRQTIELKQLGITDNDLWIASIALAHGLTVVSSDGDFNRIRQVSSLTVENWLE